MIDTMSRTFQFCLIVFIGVLWRSYEMCGVETKNTVYYAVQGGSNF